jgi:hypothetical protein
MRITRIIHQKICMLKVNKNYICDYKGKPVFSCPNANYIKCKSVSAGEVSSQFYGLSVLRVERYVSIWTTIAIS